MVCINLETKCFEVWEDENFVAFSCFNLSTNGLLRCAEGDIRLSKDEIDRFRKQAQDALTNWLRPDWWHDETLL